MTAEDRSNQERLIEVLRRAARRRGPPPSPPADVRDYDWTRPHPFTARGWERLADFARRLAARLDKALGHLIRTGDGFAADPPDACYPAAVDRGETKAYYLPLRDAAGTRCGAIRFPGPLAAAWIDTLLGGSASARADLATLSPLECGLLLDIASWMVQALSATSTALGGGEVRHEPTLTDWGEALPTHPGEELCRFTFRPADQADPAPPEPPEPDPENESDTMDFSDETPDETEPAGPDADPADAAPDAPADAPATDDAPPDDAPTLVLTRPFLDTLLGPDASAPGAADPETFRERLQERIEAVPVTVRANLGRTRVPLGDLVTLEPGDVVVLDQPLGRPMALTVDGQVVLRAKPARCGGRYAVEIQDLRRHPRLELAV